MKFLFRALRVLGLVIGGVVVIALTGGGAMIANRCLAPASGAAPLDVSYLNEKYASLSSRFLTLADGTRLHLRDEGPRDAPALMLLHGAWASLHAWEGWAERLKDRYRVISFDLPAHGLTGPVPAGRYGPAAGVELVDAVREALGIERMILAGSSAGGHIAWRYALDHSDRLEALILIDASGSPVKLDPQLEQGLTALKIPYAWCFMAGVPGRGTVAGGARATYANPRFITDALIDRTWELMRYPGSAKAFAKAFASWPAHDPRAERLSTLDLPALVLWGERDGLIPAEAGRWYGRAIPRAELIIYPDVGHAPMEEAAEQSAADLAAFLSRNGL